MAAKESPIDEIDRRILRTLQGHARATFDNIADAVGLSSSAVLRRVKRMEAAGIITGYRAVLDPSALGISLVAYVTLRLEKHGGAQRTSHKDQFKAAVQTWREVVDCVALTGDTDILMRVAVTDVEHLNRFISETLLRHPSVRDCRSSFMLESIKDAAGWPA
ncbi:Lrp/AsnC family transcriptional regulator [Xylophilus sp.]|uniref:Lrp/AsnC family transcriptional regulator n=1 Tax=Xylophilus sp. TaxID=2653893 RepID=UPI0013B6C9F1|nr:Lrp/AsnC family transcriptional regulator [Xylophilus sp.]KAF1046813.1 MAG: Leucine-responsive regulatory protein [Xylophilus sp.]